MMKTSRILFLAFLTLVSPLSLSSQEARVRTQYVKERNTTIVRTDWIPLSNTPQQFIELALRSQYTGQRLQSAPEKVELFIWSFSSGAMYKESKLQKLFIKADGESWSVEPQIYLLSKGETKDGLDIFWDEKREPPVGQPSQLPASAQIGGQGINGLFMEQFRYQLKLGQLLKIASAKSLEVQLGASKLEFSANLMNTFRNYLSRIDPSFPSPQSGANNAPPAPNAPEQDTAAEETVTGKIVSLPQPPLPPLARRAGASGVVRVLVMIDEKGNVTAARAISGHALLREVSESAARQTRFSPAVSSGKPTKVTGIIVYNFTL